MKIADDATLTDLSSRAESAYSEDVQATVHLLIVDKTLWGTGMDLSLLHINEVLKSSPSWMYT